MQIGDKILVLHRYFDGYSWEEETLSGTVRWLGRTASGDEYGMFDSDSGGGYDFYVDKANIRRHGR